MGKAVAGKSIVGARASQKDLGTEILALSLLALTAFLFLSVYSEHLIASRGASLGNFCGAAGEALGGLSLTFVGIINSYLLVVVLGAWSICTFFRQAVRRWPLRLAGVALLFPGLAVFEALMTSEPLGGAYRYRGGVWGEFLLDHVMSRTFDSVGTYLVTGLLLVIGFLLATDFLVSPLIRSLMRRGGTGAVALGRRIPSLADRLRGFVGREWPRRRRNSRETLLGTR